MTAVIFILIGNIDSLNSNHLSDLRPQQSFKSSKPGMRSKHIDDTTFFSPINQLIRRLSSEKHSFGDDDDEDYDDYGCCLTCGEFYCHSSKKCITDWDSCDLGSYDASQCKYMYNNTVDSFTYDLSKYAEALSGYYMITDEVSHPQQSFKYYFNLCQKVQSANLPTVCSSTKGTGGDTCSSDSLAYQYFSADWGYEACYRLSSCDPTNKEYTSSVRCCDLN